MSVSCSVCEKIFSNDRCLNSHQITIHGKVNEGPVEYGEDCYLYKCLEGCKISFKKNSQLRAHLKLKHQIENPIHEVSFETFEDFKLWLKTEEQNNNVRYEKGTGVKKILSLGFEKIYFNCIRSGKYRKNLNEGNVKRKRSLKSQGTSKLDRHCTSQIIVTKDVENGECTVEYYKNHYGHGTDFQHLHISQKKRESVVDQLLQGASPAQIVNATRDNIENNVKRDDFITRKDINNIKNAYLSRKEGNGTCATEKCVRNETVERKTKSENRNPPDQNIIDSRHQMALAEPTNYDIKQQGDIFSLIDNGTVVYVRDKKIRTPCNSTCKLCNICIHSYECSCTDYHEKQTICKHIHFICINKCTNEETEILQSANSDDDEANKKISNLAQQLFAEKRNSALKEAIKSVASEIIFKMEHGDYSEGILKDVLKYAKLASGCVSSETKTAGDTPKASSKKRKEQTLFPVKRQRLENTKKTTAKTDPRETATVNDTITEDIFVSCDSNNDHSY